MRRVIHKLTDGEFGVDLDDGSDIHVKVSIDRASRSGDRRLHRHLGAAAQQLQRATQRQAAVVPVLFRTPGRRRDPDERRLPEAGRGS